MNDLQEAVVELFFGGRILKGAVGDSVKQWEVGGRVLFGGRLSRITDQLCARQRSRSNSQQLHEVRRGVERSLKSYIDCRAGICQQAW